MRKLLLVLTLSAAIGAAAATAAYLFSRHWLSAPIAALMEPRVFEAPRGASLRALARSLHEQGVLEHPGIWGAWARLTQRASGLKAGEYQLTPGMTPADVLDLIHSGKVLLHSITFVEGASFADIRSALATHAAVRADYQSRSAEDVMSALGEPTLHPEGLFFPDTYHFARGTADLELLMIARRRLRSTLEEVWARRAKDLPYASAYEALIMASIVEKETALDSERARVAGVFVERLRRGMRLQTDPTVIYGMFEGYDGNIRRADLLRDTPYNTYTRAGLPPTPIAMPGLRSLQAAVQPEVTGALFFVATGEGDGSHYFSTTLAEHNAAVRRYLRTLRKQ